MVNHLDELSSEKKNNKKHLKVPTYTTNRVFGRFELLSSNVLLNHQLVLWDNVTRISLNFQLCLFIVVVVVLQTQKIIDYLGK